MCTCTVVVVAVQVAVLKYMCTQTQVHVMYTRSSSSSSSSGVVRGTRAVHLLAFRPVKIENKLGMFLSGLLWYCVLQCIFSVFCVCTAVSQKINKM